MERKEYTRYRQELFKLEAVRLAAMGERLNAQIVRELAIRVPGLIEVRIFINQSA